MSSTLAIALLDGARPHRDRLQRALRLPHVFLESGSQRQQVDAVVGFRFSADEAQRFQTRLVHVPGAGADAVDLNVLDPDSVVCNVYEHEVPVAEFALAAILNHALGYVGLARKFDSARWKETYADRRPHMEVSGRTLGLVGYGHIGQALAQRARALGMKVHAVSRSGAAPGLDWTGTAEQLPELLSQADFLVIACPLTPQTRGLIGRKELALMKPSAVLINVARAPIVDETALYEALESGRLGGATLDVWYAYPTAADASPKASRFAFEALPHVHCTPHISAWTEEMFDRRYAFIAENLSRLYQGLPLKNVVGARAKPAG